MVQDHLLPISELNGTDSAIEGQIIELYFEDNEHMQVNELYLSYAVVTESESGKVT